MITEKMFREQGKFLQSQMSKYPSDWKIKHLVFTTHLAHEVHELMDCVPWKFHRAQRAEPVERLLEEVVDCTKLIMCIMHLHGITPRQFYNAYEKKTKIVEKRAEAESEVFHADEQ